MREPADPIATTGRLGQDQSQPAPVCRSTRVIEQNRPEQYPPRHKRDQDESRPIQEVGS